MEVPGVMAATAVTHPVEADQAEVHQRKLGDVAGVPLPLLERDEVCSSSHTSHSLVRDQRLSTK